MALLHHNHLHVINEEKYIFIETLWVISVDVGFWVYTKSALGNKDVVHCYFHCFSFVFYEIDKVVFKTSKPSIEVINYCDHVKIQRIAT